MNLKTRNIVTFCLIGVAAYMAADIIHEVFGHAGTCLLIGEKISLLTSAYFKSEPGSPLTDLGGPAANLIAGILIFYFLTKSKSISVAARLFLTLIMLYNFYWFSGTVLQSLFSTIGDFTYTLKQLNAGLYGKIALAAGGVASYHFTIKLNKTSFNKIRLAHPDFPLKKFVYYSYIAGAVSAAIAGLFFSPARLAAAHEGLLEMVASIPVFFISYGDKIQADSYNFHPKFTAFNLVVGALFILFCFTLGRGFIY